jgi:hypothetical protein
MPSRRSAPCSAVAVVLGFLAFAGPHPALAADPAMSVEGSPESGVRSAAPVTVTLRPSAGLRDALRKIPDRPADGPTVRLAVSGVKAPGGASVRVFLNLPRAGASTGTDDPHYIGAMTSFEDPPDGSPGDDFILDLAPALRKLKKNERVLSGETVTLTLVVAPGSAPDEATIPVGRLALTLEPKS